MTTLAIDTNELVSMVARHGLGGASDCPSRPLADGEWTVLLSVCHRQRLIGHLCAMVTSGVFAASEDQRREITAWDLQLTAHKARLDALLVDSLDVLGAEGIDYRVLKGPVLARTAYDQAGSRHYFDIDVLAPATRFDDAVDVLIAIGFERRAPPIRPGYDARFAKGVTLRTPDGFELDLHRTLAAGPFGLLIDLDRLWASSSSVDIDGSCVHCLGPEDNLLHACCNAALGDLPARWSVLRDIVQLLCNVPLDPDRVVSAARHHHVGIAVSEGMQLAATKLGGIEHHELVHWARTYEPTRAERRRLRVYRDRRNYAAQSFESLRVLHGLGDRVAFGRAAVFPSSEFLTAFDTTRSGWLRKGNRSLRAKAE